MAEPMQVWVEVWPLAADETGLWLLSGDDAWRPPTSVPADSEPHFEVELILRGHGVLEETALIHSTSWRADGPSVVLTYAAVVPVEDAVRLGWPGALPLSPATAKAVGPAPEHMPTAAPEPRYIDVLKHAVRHLAFLHETDDASSAALPPHWATHLAGIRPALARMYSR